MIKNNKKYNNSFVKWLMDTQLVIEKSAVWLALFKNIITIIFTITFIFLIFRDKKIPTEFSMLLTMTISFYFKDKKDSE